MKQTKAGLRGLFLLSGIMFTVLTGCKKNEQLPGSPESRSALARAAVISKTDLIANKSSSNQLMMGYYRTWGDKTVTGNSGSPAMTDMPDGVDILSVFADYTPSGSPFWSTLKAQYIPALHARGTKVIYTGGYFAGASTNPTGLANWVQGILNTINEYNYDGYDIDIESTASGATLQDQIACFQALSRYLGPQSGTGKLLIYDTNQNGNALMNAIKNMVNYVFLQAYWRNASSLSGTLSTYTPYISKSKFLVGVSFEDGTGNQPGQMPAYTQWAVQNQTGGVFSYGIDQEFVDNGNSTTRAAIQVLNSAHP